MHTMSKSFFWNQGYQSRDCPLVMLAASLLLGRCCIRLPVNNIIFGDLMLCIFYVPSTLHTWRSLPEVNKVMNWIKCAIWDKNVHSLGLPGLGFKISVLDDGTPLWASNCIQAQKHGWLLQDHWHQSNLSQSYRMVHQRLQSLYAPARALCPLADTWHTHLRFMSSC